MADKGKITGKNNITNSFVNGNGEHLKFTNKSVSIYSNDPRSDHSSTHINVDHNKGTVTVNTKDSNGNKSSSTGNCFLTSACISHFQEDFDDNCYELTILRWFRDNFVSEEDVEHYYQTAPVIIEGINLSNKSDVIYNYIYDNVVKSCVTSIENGDYDIAYKTYKHSILAFEEIFARPVLEEKFIRVLKHR